METDWECESAALAGTMADPLMVYLRSLPPPPPVLRAENILLIVKHLFGCFCLLNDQCTLMQTLEILVGVRILTFL